MKAIVFYCERIGKQVFVKGIKLPNDFMFHLFWPADQNLNSHPIVVQNALNSVQNRSRKKVILRDEYFSLYWKDSSFEFKGRKLMPAIKPIPLNIDRQIENIKKNQVSYDKFKLNKLVFLKDEIDPLNFLEEFDSCFSKDFQNEEKSIHLLRHIPAEDKQKFSSIWSLPIAEQYDALKNLFLDVYLVDYIKHKSSKLNPLNIQIIHR